MAQETLVHSQQVPNKTLLAKNVAVAVTAVGNATLLEIDIPSGVDRIGIQVKPIGQAFDAFVVQGKAHPDAAYVQLTAAVSATADGLVLFSTATLATLAAGTEAFFVLAVKGLSKVKILASVAVADATADIFARAM